MKTSPDYSFPAYKCIICKNMVHLSDVYGKFLSIDNLSHFIHGICYLAVIEQSENSAEMIIEMSKGKITKANIIAWRLRLL